MLLSDTVLLHRALRRAGIPAELHVTEAAGHGGFMGMAPEDQEILAEVRRFADDALGQGVAMTSTRREADPEARTAAGRVRGRSEGGVAVFRGIPFAQPPTGRGGSRGPRR